MIFEEITNKLDEKNEKLIMDTLYEINKDKTMIIVSHNKNNLSKCDYILEIQNKSVIRVLKKNEKNLFYNWWTRVIFKKLY
jgi:ABC-type transport system involved in cytochrome bd biosynthesis fused ATPase/permease subunit